MSHNRHKATTSIVFLIMLVSVTNADWPQFQGPNRNGISPEKINLIKHFPETGPKILWKTEISPGFGGASIEGNEVYLIEREDDEKDVIKCFDFTTGKELWRCENKVSGRLDFSGGKSTPTLHGDYVYAVGPFGHVYFCNRKTQKIEHVIDIEKQFNVGDGGPSWGYAQSPLIYKDKLIITPMSWETGMVALNLKDASVAWKTRTFLNAPPGGGGDEAEDDEESEGSEETENAEEDEEEQEGEGEGPEYDGEYSSSILTTIAETEGILYIAVGHLVFVDPQSGEILWDYTKFPTAIPIPFPTRIDNNRVFVTAGYGGGSTMLHVSKQNDEFKLKELFRLKDLGSQLHLALYHNDALFANFNTREMVERNRPPGLVCLDLNGNMLWQTKKKPNIDFGNLIIADNKLIFIDGKTGTLYLAETSTKEYKELAKGTIFERRQKRTWAPMAISKGKLIVRGPEKLVCIDLREE